MGTLKQTEATKRWRKEHPEKVLEYTRKYRASHPGATLKFSLKKYGLRNTDYLEMAKAQSNGCAICAAQPPFGKRKRLLVDHDHKDGFIRGLLCHKCNVALAGFNEEPERLAAAIRYLNGAAAAKKVVVR